MSGTHEVREIVVGVDGSPESDAAVRWAAREAATRGWGVAVLHVNSIGSHGLWATSRLVRDELRAMGQPVVDDAVALVRHTDPSVPVRGRVLLGPAARTMLNLTAYAPLTVVGLRGRGAVSRLIAGSVSQRLMSHATQPLVVVPITAQDATARRVVLGIEEPPNDAAEEYAFRIAHDRRIPLLAVRTTTDPGDLDSERELVAKRICERCSECSDVDATCVAVQGQPGDVLDALCLPTDLLVVGQHRHGTLSPATLGPVVGRIAHAAPCPVLVVPQLDAT